jgi:hypothetical protein
MRSRSPVETERDEPEVEKQNGFEVVERNWFVGEEADEFEVERQNMSLV